MKIKLDKKEWKYLLLIYAIAYIVQIFVIVKGGEEYSMFTPIVGIMMFLPAISAIVSLLNSKEGLRYINWRLGKPIYLILGLILPAIITICSVFFFEKIGLGKNIYFEFDDGRVNVLKEIFVFGKGSQSVIFFLFNFFITGIVYTLITSVFTLGEEIGWRGYLQKKLLEKNSIIKSLIFLGLVWAFWHLPFILNGYNYPEFPVLGGVLLFPATLVCSSFLMGWLTINGKSIWPAVFTHAGVNSIMIVRDSMEFGENKLIANFIIVGIWMLVAILAYILIKKE